jgi:nucleoside-diphosphate-sugar epimerase
MRRKRKIIEHGDGTSLWTTTHNTDFAKAFVGLFGNPRALGHAVHIPSDEVLTWDQITRAIGSAAGVAPDIIHVPSDVIAAFDPEARGPLLGDKAHCAVFDNSKIQSMVPGYCATVPFSEGVRKSVQWHEERAERRTVDEAFDANCKRIVSAYETALGRGAL